MTVRIPLLRLVLGAVTFAWLTGCAGYQLGDGVAPRFRTLFIAPVAGGPGLPQSRAQLTTGLRSAFLKDGRVTLVNAAAEADAVLELSLASYGREVSVSRADDTGLARRFEIILRAEATLTDRRENKVVFAQRPLEARRGVFTDSGLVPAETQALPLLVEQLAGATVNAVLDTW